MARVERPPGPIRARLLRLRRGFGRTRPGRALKRFLGREVRIPVAAEPNAAKLLSFPGEDELPSELRDGAILESALRPKQRTPRTTRRNGTLPAPEETDGTPRIVNVVLVSHCNFKGNSAFHVHAVASELHRRGLSPVIAVPDEPETVADVGRPPFPVLTYDQTLSDALRFPNGLGPDLVHAFTPRELVRALAVELVRAHGCRYLVHLEDNEEVVLSAEHGGMDVGSLKELPPPMIDRIVRQRQAHPLRAARFLEQASGVTVLVERLLELVPTGVPTAVMRAGFDEAVLAPTRTREEVRVELRLEPSDLAIVYPGNIHMVNIEEMRSLYEAVALLRKQDQPVVLVKTGWGSTQTVTFPALGDGVRDLGWIPRATIPDLLGAADVLVQPGGPGPFNDYRFPSKLPEFLASGRPVVLPRTNVGLLLRDGEDALLLERGDATEIASAVALLAADPALRARLGEAGRAFALRELRWTHSVDTLQDLHRRIAASRRRPPPAWALDGADPPVKLVALVDAAPSASEAAAARAHGVYGFCCVDFDVVAAKGDFRYCFRSDGDGGADDLVLLADPLYIRVDGAPLRVAVEQGTRVHERLTSGGSLHGVALAADESNYAVVLRKAVLQALLLADMEEPLVLIDASQVWVDQDRRAEWLARTHRGLREGLRQYYASRSVPISDVEADRIVSAS